MKRKIIIIVVAVLLVAGFVVKLAMNKKEIDANAAPKDIKVDVPVSVVDAKSSLIDNSFNVNGNFLASKELTIFSQTQGKLMKVNFEVGSFVKEGQALAVCDLELLEAQQSLAIANVDKLKNDVKKFEEMSKSNAVTQ